MGYRSESIAATIKTLNDQILPSCDPARIRLGTGEDHLIVRFDHARLSHQLIPVLGS